MAEKSTVFTKEVNGEAIQVDHPMGGAIITLPAGFEPPKPDPQPEPPKAEPKLKS